MESDVRETSRRHPDSLAALQVEAYDDNTAWGAMRGCSTCRAPELRADADPPPGERHRARPWPSRIPPVDIDSVMAR
jgi:hypothetical protein